MEPILFSDYLHEKTGKSRDNETFGDFLIAIGSIFFVGRLLEIVIFVENLE